MKNKIIVIIPSAIALVGAICWGNIESKKNQAKLRVDHAAWAERCINVNNSDMIKGTTPACEGVKTQYLSEKQRADYVAAYAKHKEVKAKQKADQEARAAQERADFAAQEKVKHEAARKAEAEREALGEWAYAGYTDNATGKYTKTASLTSKNSMNFGFPYSGTQYGRFTIRNHPRFGVDAFLRIEKGQLLCNSYSNTNVLVRFDNGPATRYSCNGAADHSSEIAFINNVAGLETGMKTATKMYITVSVYQEGSRTWEFSVKGYDRSKV